MKIVVRATIEVDDEEPRGFGFAVDGLTPWKEVCHRIERMRASILRDLHDTLKGGPS